MNVFESLCYEYDPGTGLQNLNSGVLSSVLTNKKLVVLLCFAGRLMSPSLSLLFTLSVTKYVKWENNLFGDQLIQTLDESAHSVTLIDDAVDNDDDDDDEEEEHTDKDIEDED